MKRTTIKWRIFKYNIIAILVLIALTTIVFNFSVRQYIKNDITRQLNTISTRAEETALKTGPNFFDKRDTMPPPPDNKPDNSINTEGVIGPDNPDSHTRDNTDLFRFYFMLDRSLREPLSVLNADYILLDTNKEVISLPQESNITPSEEVLIKIKNEISKAVEPLQKKNINFTLSGTEYTAIINPVSTKNNFGLGWIVTYSSLKKVNQLQLTINLILFIILVLSALIIAVFSSMAAKKITAPFASLNEHIGKIAERNFGEKIKMPVDDELKDLVNNINVMSEKLETYDKAQKTFLQNASHEFRTPLMSIQSYAEGIKYDVVDPVTASSVIIDEAKRMTDLVGDLLYLSRLDAIEESYHYGNLDFDDFIISCLERMNGIAVSKSITLSANRLNENIYVYADEEKLSRAFTNIIGNCIRYAKSKVEISSEIQDNKIITVISDDGPGFDENELPHIFDRFYKGKKGNFGLGLAISQNVIEKHEGTITAENSGTGALFRIELKYIGK